MDRLGGIELSGIPELTMKGPDAEPEAQGAAETTPGPIATIICGPLDACLHWCENTTVQRYLNIISGAQTKSGREISIENGGTHDDIKTIYDTVDKAIGKDNKLGAVAREFHITSEDLHPSCSVQPL